MPRREVDWDAVADVVLPDLGPASAPAQRGRLDGLLLEGLTAGDAERDGLDLRESAVRACTVERARARRALLRECVVEECGAGELDLADAALTDAVVRRCRLGAVVAHGASLQRVTLAGSRLDYVNLRGATLDRVQLLDCRLGELDLGGARLSDVRLVGCTVDRLVLQAATCERLDLRGADLGALEGLDGLRGSVLTPDQLVRLAPALADHLGIGVRDPDRPG